MTVRPRFDPERMMDSLYWWGVPTLFGYEVITMARYHELGLPACLRLIQETIGDGPVYITFDLGSLDPTVAPAVSNLEPGEEGFRINEAMALIRSLRGKNIIGGDVVCLMPTKDQPNNITSMIAASVMFEIISPIVDRHQR